MKTFNLTLPLNWSPQELIVKANYAGDISQDIALCSTIAYLIGKPFQDIQWFWEDKEYTPLKSYLWSRGISQSSINSTFLEEINKVTIISCTKKPTVQNPKNFGWRLLW